MGVLRDNLSPTDFADAVCRVGDWRDYPHFGNSHVRVWLCKCGNHWFQRHEWQEPGKNETRRDEWIYAGYSNTRKIPDHMKNDGLRIIKEESL